MMDRQIEQLTEVWTFVNTSPNGVIIVDENRKILFANRAMETYTGFPLKQLNEMHLEDMVPDGCSVNDCSSLSSIMTNGSCSGIVRTVPLKRMDGKVIAVDVEKRVYKYQDGTRRYTGIVTPMGSVSDAQ